MDDVLFGVIETAPKACACGVGWCPTHGTWHYATDVEVREAERRADQTEMMKGTHGGHRVIKKKVGGDK